MARTHVKHRYIYTLKSNTPCHFLASRSSRRDTPTRHRSIAQPYDFPVSSPLYICLVLTN
ncbi:hypothetical protein E2C01_093698 [Portunus trituberculatus]|uniref:Uncharacterized protein n=1 Tax=Portunus trituberculatus TaxID=210409 RepID=A0A5B7JQH4_PORTR|nr:hypothetical protein [Portunus trituberculatus]